MAGSITAEDREFVETWECLTSQRTAIIKMTPRGDETRQMVTKGTFMCTSEERLITQDRVVNPKDDPFRNGRFRPVVVPPSVTVEANPNAMSDDEIVNVLLKSSDFAFSEWMDTLDSLETLSRMRNIALSNADDITLARFRSIENRLSELQPAPAQTPSRSRGLLESIG